MNFSECFSAWLHVKALRVFVESVLRYGLPVNFAAFLIFPNKKSTKRLHDVLNNLYGHLDGGASVQSSNLIMDVSTFIINNLFEFEGSFYDSNGNKKLSEKQFYNKCFPIIFKIFDKKRSLEPFSFFFFLWIQLIFIFQNVDIPGLSFGQSEYYPYVCYKINIEMVDHKI